MHFQLNAFESLRCFYFCEWWCLKVLSFHLRYNIDSLITAGDGCQHRGSLMSQHLLQIDTYPAQDNVCTVWRELFWPKVLPDAVDYLLSMKLIHKSSTTPCLLWTPPWTQVTGTWWGLCLWASLLHGGVTTEELSYMACECHGCLNPTGLLE